MGIFVSTDAFIDFSEQEFNVNEKYIYYTKEGYYLGGSADSKKVYIVTQREYETAQQTGNWFLINKSENLLKEINMSIANSEFTNDAYILFKEISFTGNKQTAIWMAHTVNNAVHSAHNRGKKTINQLLKTSYSSVKNKNEHLPLVNNPSLYVDIRYGLINVLTNHPDPTGKAYFWDGLDLLTQKIALSHAKFKHYKSVTIKASYLIMAVEFWSIPENKRKVNPNAVINSAFETKGTKTFPEGIITYDDDFFVAKRYDTQDAPNVHYHLIATGFHSGTMFWTTKK